MGTAGIAVGNSRIGANRTDFGKATTVPIGPAELRGKKTFYAVQATATPVVRPPRQRMFISSSSTPWRAEKSS